MEGRGVMLVPSVDFKLSKVEILRGVVCEKLTTAAQEIFAVVERTVSGYEEEAAALRREIDRQKILLEAVLQPRVNLCRTEPAGGEIQQDELQQTNEKDSASLTSLKHKQEVVDKEKEQNECGSLNLQVCLLHEVHTDMLTRNVFKSSVQEVTCPPDLKEAEFLDLLRSTFPQLSEEFEAFTVDVNRKLTPLNLETLTPKNIEAAIKSRGNGRSALFIRVKAVKETQSSLEQPPPSEMTSQTKDDVMNEEKGSNTSSSSCDVEKAESHQQNTKQKKDVEHEEISKDFIAPDFTDCGADSDDGDDFENFIDDKDKEWKPDENNKEMKSVKPKRNPRERRKKKMNSVVKRKNQNLEESSPHSCKVCQALSGTNNMLIKHSWSHVNDPEGLCGVCGERSASPEELKSHLSSHKKTYSCELCGKNLLSQTGLKRHAMLHSGEKPFRCDICEKSFVCLRYLKNHQLEHGGEKPYRCDICNKTFTLKKRAQMHRWSHTRERPHTCDVCGKTFIELRRLSQHKLVHSGQRRYVCQVCRKCFVTPLKLKLHEKIHSERMRSYLCDICCKAFHTTGQLSAHLKIHSEEKVACGVCGKGLSSRGALKRHLAVHTGEKAYKCSVCGETFAGSGGLRVHMTCHTGVKPYVCSVCGRAFSRSTYLIVHMRTHTGEKPYSCTICDKSFTQSHCLKKHMERHQKEEEDNQRVNS